MRSGARRHHSKRTFDWVLRLTSTWEIAVLSAVKNPEALRSPQRGSAEGAAETQQTDEKLLRGTRILKSSRCKVPGSATVARTSWWERTPPPPIWRPTSPRGQSGQSDPDFNPQTRLEAARLSGLFLRGQVSLVCWEEQRSHKFLLNKRDASRGVKFYARPSSRPDLL